MPLSSAVNAPCQLKRSQKRPRIEQTNSPDISIEIILVI